MYSGTATKKQIFIKTIMGNIIILEFETLDAKENAEAKIQDKEGILPDHQNMLPDYNV